MPHTRRTNTALNYNLIGIDVPEIEGVSGVIRFSGKSRVSGGNSYGVKGITIPFQHFGPEDTQISEDDAIFFGTMRDLKTMYRGAVEVDNLETHIDRDFSPTSLGHKTSSFYAIPINRLNLGPKIQDVLYRGLDFLPEVTEELVGKMEKVTIADGSKKEFSQRFAYYPRFIKELAEKSGNYHLAKTTKTASSTEKVVLPEVRVISVPFGGFRGWKERLKKRR